MIKAREEWRMTNEAVAVVLADVTMEGEEEEPTAVVAVKAATAEARVGVRELRKRYRRN